MKTRYFANRHIIDGDCIGLVKVEMRGGEVESGYFFDGKEWVRDDWKATNKAFGENMDYFEIEESEVEECMRQKAEQVSEV